MSGIAALLRFDGRPVAEPEIGALTAAMRHRGPDGIGHWRDGPVALGHCLFRAGPEASERAEPLLSQDKCLALVFDGRIDNRGELAREVRAKGARLRSASDAELVLGAYEVFGADCPRHLLGDFAFVLWDGRRKELFSARDHLGVKPYYYFLSPDFLAVSSEEEGFFGLDEVPREPNPERIGSVFAPMLDEQDFSQSWLKDIVKLPPGKSMRVSVSGRAQISTYWQLEPGEEIRFRSDAEAEEAFRVHFVEAIRCRVGGPAPPALSLSGGIDSASIAGAVRSGAVGDVALHTYSVVSDDAATCDETQNIRAVNAGHERHAHLLKVPSLEGGITLEDLRHAAWDMAHPMDNSIMLPRMMYLMAARHGHRVMFDGIDGDLANYVTDLYLVDLLRAWRLLGAWTEARLAATNNAYVRHLTPATFFARNAWSAFVPHGIKRVKNALLGVEHPYYLYKDPLINPAFAREIRLDERMRQWQAARVPSYRLTQQQRHVGELFPTGIARSMESFGRAAARYGIEARHPWTDKRLLEFLIRLPLVQRIGGGRTKWLVRRATEPWLPEAVRQHAAKKHLGWALTTHVMADSRGVLESALGAPRQMAISRFVDTTGLGRKIAAFESGSQLEEYKGQLFGLATLAVWLQRVAEGRTNGLSEIENSAVGAVCISE